MTLRREARRKPSACLRGLVACGVLGGLLAAAAALPVVGSVGLTANKVATTFIDLPPSPREDPLSQRTVLLDRHGKQFAQFYEQNRTVVKLDQVAPVMRKAIVAIEDARFYEHGGLDIKGTMRALVTNTQAGGVSQGGSSLTQQLVKNMLVENAEHRATSATRPARRASAQAQRAAVRAGDGEEVHQGPRSWSGTSTSPTSARAPSGWRRRPSGSSAIHGVRADPAAGGDAGRRRADAVLDRPRRWASSSRSGCWSARDIVLDRMAELEMITPAEADAAKAEPLGIQLQAGARRLRRERLSLLLPLRPARDADQPRVRQAAPKRRAAPGPRRPGDHDHPGPGDAAGGASGRSRRGSTRDDTEVAAEAMVEPGTGRIRAHGREQEVRPQLRQGQERPRPPTTWPPTWRTAAAMGFQAGSTFKVFTLATALSKGRRFDDGFMTPGAVRAVARGSRTARASKVNAPGTADPQRQRRGQGRPAQHLRPAPGSR